MTNTEYLIEVSILSTVLFAHQQCKDEQYFNDLELQEEWFLIPFHKIIIKTINHNKALSIPIYEEYISDELIKNNIMNYEQWFTITSANPFSSANFKIYLDTLKGGKKSLIEGI